MPDLRTPEIIAWGEVLWDCLPRGMFPGGAPFNVACHCARLGCHTAIASAVGADFPGRILTRLAVERGVDPRFLSVNSCAETGHVLASLDALGNASYEIRHPVAWDSIPVSPELLAATPSAKAIVFGSLAQRDPANLVSLKALLAAAKTGGALRVFDVNLRPPFSKAQTVLDLARHADLLKLNEEEVHVLTKGSDSAGQDLPALCAWLAAETGAVSVCVTLGDRGAAWWCHDFFVCVPAPAVHVVDTVGAGDAFLACLLCRMLANPFATAETASRALEDAVALGAIVAGREGAFPEL